MRLPSAYLLLLAASCIYKCVVGDDHKNDRAHLVHANHIFNAINGAMRQWSSSIHHNGMSAFIATVPADTEFYHGTRTPYRINGTEWLAFEPEHALLFAGQLHGSPPGGRRPAPPSSNMQDVRSARSEPPQQLHLHDMESQQQQRLSLSQDQRDHLDQGVYEWEHGYLHTYRTKHPLRLLYVDGQSAAKSLKGTLDMQDVVILRNDLGQPIDGPFRGPLGETERAASLCKRAREQWNNNIDGILRMEGGFEIILCSFEEHLDLISINQATATPSNNKPNPGHRSNMLGYYQAVASRYDGIGGDRVKLDFDDFVSLFLHPDTLYFDSAGRPRAVNETAILKTVRADIDKIAGQEPSMNQSFNWQAVTDMVVARYADRIAYLISDQCNSTSKFHLEIDFAMHPFIDYAFRDAAKELERCTAQFMPPPQRVSHIRDVIEHISSTICGSLQLARASEDIEEAKAILDDLKQWLAWPVWKRCRGCSLNEVCFVAIWPAGSVEDLEHPRCRSNMNWSRNNDSYWTDEPNHNSAEIALAQRLSAWP